MNDLLSRTKIRLNNEHIMNEWDSPVTEVVDAGYGSVTIKGRFCWSESVTVSTNAELTEAMNMIRSASWNKDRHEHAKEYVRSRQLAVMKVSSTLLKPYQLESLYLDGLQDARVRVL